MTTDPLKNYVFFHEPPDYQAKALFSKEPGASGDEEILVVGN